MYLDELVSIVKGELINNYKQVKIKDFKIDSRELKKKDCFIALKGKKYNGHDFINDNMHVGVVVVDEDIKVKNTNVIKVDSTYNALYNLTKHKLKKRNIPIIAITGSNGKTTLKELIYNILSNKYRVLKSSGNNNNLIGVFKTINKLDKEDIIVIELGMNHKGELKELSNMIEPNCAVITNIGSSHIGNLGSRKNIYKAKLEITSGLKGDLIVNGDDKYLKKTKGYKCGINYNNDLIAYNINIVNNCLEFNIYLDNEYLIRFPIATTCYIPSLLEAIKVGINYDIELIDIVNTINNYKPYNKRLKEIKLDNYVIIDDSYNASYESMKCGLELLSRIKTPKIIILADMLELGKYSIKYHKKLNHIIDKIDNKITLTVGNFSKYIHSKHFNSNQDIINYLKGIDLIGTTIFIKGSNSMNLYEIVDYLKSLKFPKKP